MWKHVASPEAASLQGRYALPQMRLTRIQRTPSMLGVSRTKKLSWKAQGPHARHEPVRAIIAAVAPEEC